MKTTAKTLLATLMLFAFSCTKENTSIEASGIADNSLSHNLLSEMNAPAAITSVKIGYQTWMNKNLNVTRYKNGDKIPQVKNPTAWAGLTTGAWCWYNNDSATYAATYGRLYNWYAVNDPRGLAPEGWHMPSDAEWTTLSTFLGGEPVAGGKLKEAGIIHWQSPNTGATNSSGFAALPGGLRDTRGTFLGGSGTDGSFWSSSEGGTAGVWGRDLWYGLNSIFRSNYGKQTGLSVRCVKDEVFDTVVIGSQVWMKKNWARTTYRNGDPIPQVTDPSAWKDLTTGAWCWYNNDSATYGATYGKLYNWYAVNDPRGLAPTGWHIPTGTEWSKLSNYLGGDSLAGSKMKETGTVHWTPPNAYATNSSGFTGLPGGFRFDDGSFNSLSYIGNWWSSTERSSGLAGYVDLVEYNGVLGKHGYSKRTAFSIRCLKD